MDTDMHQLYNWGRSNVFKTHYQMHWLGQWQRVATP